MFIQEVANIVAATFVRQSENLSVRHLIYDSRKASGTSDELFVALPGTRHDGHEFIRELYDRGVRHFLIAKKLDIDAIENANILLVPDTLIALQKLAEYHRQQFDFPVVGITGSNGKTIVKEWLTSILEQEWNVTKSPKSFNSQLGVPLSIWEIRDQQMGVFEAGVSLPEEMEKLEKIIRPTLGIFTNIGEAHSEGFDDRHQKLREKCRLFTNSEKVICRMDYEEISNELALLNGPKVVTWGIDAPAAQLNFQPENNGYSVRYGQQEFSFLTQWTNPLDLENLFHSISAAIVLGEKAGNIQKGIKGLKAIPMRLELKRGNNNTHILDDSYNNDLLGLSIALDYLHQQPQKNQRTVILSDILQSGKSPQKLYEAVNNLLEKHHVDRLIGIGTAISQATFSVPSFLFQTVNDFLQNAPDFADETILVKGARDFGLERIVAYLEEKNHGTVLEVNFEAILHNLNVYRSVLNPEVKLMVMVKAFAYGVGVEEIANLLQYHHVDYLGVAYLDEAINLRRKGIKLPIMIMNVDWNSFSLLETFDLYPEIYSLSMLQAYLQVTKNPPPIHLKIETGMNRLGFALEELSGLIKILKANPHVKIAGIFTHFSCADDPAEDAYTRQQAAIFDQAYSQLSEALGYQPLKHALNSAGILRLPNLQYDMVRLGIGLYGYDSSQTINSLRNISQLKTKISQVKKVKKGDSIGYSRKGRAKKDGQIATIAIGYADGYSRAFGNGNAVVGIKGQKAPTIGNICMDMTMVDVTGLDVHEGDEVVVFGVDPDITDLAKWANTIPYEILTNVSSRVKRVFVSE